MDQRINGNLLRVKKILYSTFTLRKCSYTVYYIQRFMSYRDVCSHLLNSLKPQVNER